MDLQQNLKQHLLEIVRERDPYFAPQGHFYVETYLQQTLSQWGTVEIHEFKVKARTHRNLQLNLPSRDDSRSGRLRQRSSSPSAPILIGAHYDGVPHSPAADDNASGVAVLLELARHFHRHPAKRPLRLIAFDLEEYGLIGSEIYAKQLAAQQEKIHIMLSLEMLGFCSQERHSQHYPAPLEKFYPDRGNFLALVGNIPTIPAMVHLGHHVRKAGVPSQWLPAGWKGKLIRETRLSDHAPFWDLGYPAIMVTDTAYLRNPNYHQPTDTLDTLDLDFMAGICRGLQTGIDRL